MEKWQKHRKHHIYESEQASPFSAGHHKAAMDRQDSMPDTKHIQNIDPQKKHRLGTVSNFFTGDIKLVSW